jgi:hypothetical protein
MERKALRAAAIVLSLLTLVPGLLFSEDKTDAERDKQAAVQAAALAAASKQYILLKRGQWEVENGISYAYYSANQIYLQSFALLDPVFLTLGEFGVKSRAGISSPII